MKYAITILLVLVLTFDNKTLHLVASTVWKMVDVMQLYSIISYKKTASMTYL